MIFKDLLGALLEKVVGSVFNDSSTSPPNQGSKKKFDQPLKAKPKKYYTPQRFPIYKQNFQEKYQDVFFLIICIIGILLIFAVVSLCLYGLYKLADWMDTSIEDFLKAL